jgi:hypothetical protein
MIETIRIGHMIGPPLRKLSIKKFELNPLGFVGASAGAGLSVAVTVAAGDVTAPGGGGTAGAPGGKLAVGSCGGAAGFTGAAAGGLAAAGAPGFTGGGAPGGDVCGGAGDCADEVSANASENKQAVSNVFIVDRNLVTGSIAVRVSVIANVLVASPAKLFTFFRGHFDCRRSYL